MLRKPLQDVILGLRNMLEDSAGFDGVVPVLQVYALCNPAIRALHKLSYLLKCESQLLRMYIKCADLRSPHLRLKP